MRKFQSILLIMIAGILFLCALTACSGNQDDASTTATTVVAPPPTQSLTIVPRPEKLVEMMKQPDEVRPVVKITTPEDNHAISGPTVRVKVNLSGVQSNLQSERGIHLHLILDNEPYEDHYDVAQPFEFKNVAAGRHTLRVFAARPWHESYKNQDAFQIVRFTVKDGADAIDRSQGAPAEIELSQPLLTYNSPNGKYKGAEADPIMLDFWLSNAKLKGDGGQFRLRYIIDDDEPRYIDKWEPVWLSGWIDGKHTVRLELVGPDDWPFKNGDFNITTHEITVEK